MKLWMTALLLAVGTAVWAAPIVDGTIADGEYANTKTVLDGNGLLAWSNDAAGLTVALKVKTEGWIGVGFGSDRMAGAFIFMGFVASDGKAVFSEQKGQGHRHNPVDQTVADKSAVTWAKGNTVIEFHIPAAKIPFKLGTVPFITAYSDSADLTTFHGENLDTGSVTIR
jgi:hypothetical protein